MKTPYSNPHPKAKSNAANPFFDNKAAPAFFSPTTSGNTPFFTSTLQLKEDPEYSESNSILGGLETTGAGEATKGQDGLEALSGVEASEKMAETDAARIKAYIKIFNEVGSEKGLPPALLAAIASRESRGGGALDSEGMGDNGNGYGLMQVDINFHETKGEYNSKEHVAQAAGILKGYLDAVKEKHPDWTKSQQLRGAVAAYNVGVKNVQTLAGMDVGTTGDDYSSDVWARARYYAALPAFQQDAGLINDESVPKDPYAMDQIVADVYLALKGPGTDETLLIEALSRLGQDDGKIAVFAADFKSKYTYDPINWIQSDLSNNFYDGNIKDLANRLLNIKSDKKLSKEKEKKTATVKVKKTLNVRSSPDSSSDGNIVRKLQNGDVVNVVKEIEGWLQIGRKEWISSAFADVKTEKSTVYNEEAIKAVAKLAYDAMNWPGTDEMGLLNALAQLENNPEVIAKFKKIYSEKYGEEVEQRIDEELNDWFTDRKYYITAMQLLGARVQEPDKDKDKAPDGGKGAVHNENVYTIMDEKAIVRDEKGNYPAEGYEIIPKWTTVTLLETKEVIPEGKTNKITNAKVSYKEGENTVTKWTSMGNLYEQFWDPKDHKEEYENVDKGYAEAMLAVDTEKTRAAKIKSGPGVSAVVDQFYPNSKELSSLSSEFRPKISAFINFIEEQGISVTVNAALRHPLRSLVFQSTILAAGTKDDLMKAQAQSIKYSLPIDWLHYKADGTLDVAKSKNMAENVKTQFGIGDTAARGVKDALGGSYSNHNFGNAVDLQMTFGFDEKTIQKDGKSYVINKANETPHKINKKWVLANCGSKPLAKLGKEGFGVTRVLSNDAIHWSATGN